MGRAFSKILTLAILIAIAIGGFFAWQYFIALEEPLAGTANWQIYKNAKYGIEFQYPNSWTLDDKEALSVDLPDQTRNFVQINVSNGISGLKGESVSPCQPGVASIVYQVSRLRDSQQTFEEFVNFQIENPERGMPPSVKPVLTPTTVGGQDALKIQRMIDNCTTEFYYIEQNLDRYMTVSFIADKDGDKLIFNQMLSTFKFIEVEKEVVGWKTYQNEEYGFEFEYPTSMDINYEGKTEYALEPLRVDFGVFAVRVWDDSSRRSIKDFFLELACTQNKPMCEYFDQGYSLERIIVGSRSGWTTNIGVKSYFLVLLFNSRYLLEFMNRWPNDAEKTETFNQIISTFRFLE